MSNQVSCPRGHLYDSSLPSCPFCLPNAGQAVGPTVPFTSAQGGLPPTGAVGGAVPPTGAVGGAVPPTGALNQGGNISSKPIDRSMQETQVADDLLTQAGTHPQPTRVRPVVGWLVCVQGNDIGKDFRLHANFNSVGRGENQDVRINDDYVSREHFVVSYDMVNNRYFADMGQGKTFVYINGYPLGARTQLRKGDQIKVANTLLVFIPLEQQDVKWNWKI